MEIRDEYMKKELNEIIDVLINISTKTWIFIFICIFHFLAMT